MLPGPTTIKVDASGKRSLANAMVKIDYNPSDANTFSFRWAKQGRFAVDFWNTCVPNRIQPIRTAR
jgi:hypothetical protein